MIFFSFRSVTSWNEMLAGAPGGGWKGALPGAEGSLKERLGAGRELAPLPPQRGRDSLESFLDSLSQSPRTAGTGEETSGDTHGAMGSRSPALSSCEWGELRSWFWPPRGRGPPMTAPPWSRPPSRLRAAPLAALARSSGILWARGSPAPPDQMLF